MEATEEDHESPGQDNSQPGMYTEHVFTDPLGTESAGESTGADNQRYTSRWACYCLYKSKCEWKLIEFTSQRIGSGQESSGICRRTDGCGDGGDPADEQCTAHYVAGGSERLVRGF